MSATAGEVSPQDQLAQLLSGKWVTQAIAVAAELSVADALEAGPRSAQELAETRRVSPNALHRLLRALAALGIFCEVAPQRYENTELSNLLRANVPGSARAMALWAGESSRWQAWGHLSHSISTEQPAFRQLFGQDFFEYCRQHRDTAQKFNAVMTELSELAAQAVVGAYDFSPCRHIVDVGGGHGALLASLLAAAPNARGTLFDLPGVVAEAPAVLHKHGVAERVTPVGGSFLDAVPAGGDTYVLKWVLHDWHDQGSLTILKNCRRAMPEGGKLLVIEQVLGDGPGSAFAKLLDLEMLIVTEGGRERSAQQFAELFTEAGFRLTRIVPTRSPFCIVEATPAAPSTRNPS
jgi:hypothetical protein